MNTLEYVRTVKLGVSPSPKWVNMFLTHRYVGEDDSLPDVGFGVFFNVYHYYRKNIYQDGYYAHLSNRPRIRKDIVSKHRILKVTFVLFERMAIAEFRLWQVPHEI